MEKVQKEKEVSARPGSPTPDQNKPKAESASADKSQTKLGGTRQMSMLPYLSQGSRPSENAGPRPGLSQAWTSTGSCWSRPEQGSSAASKKKEARFSEGQNISADLRRLFSESDSDTPGSPMDSEERESQNPGTPQGDAGTSDSRQNPGAPRGAFGTSGSPVVVPQPRAQSSGTPIGEASTSGQTGSAAPTMGKNHEKNRKRKEAKRMFRELKKGSTDHVATTPAGSGTSTAKRLREPSTGGSSGPSTKKQARDDGPSTSRASASQDSQAKPKEGGTKASYAKVAQAGGFTLVVQKREEEEFVPVVEDDRWDIAHAIGKAVFQAPKEFFPHIMRTVLHGNEIRVVCENMQTLEWAKEVISGTQPKSAESHRYAAWGPNDLPPGKTYGVWLPERTKFSIKETLSLVERCNAGLSAREMEPKWQTPGKGGVLHVVEVRGQSLESLKELNLLVWAGASQIRFQEKKKGKEKQSADGTQSQPEGSGIVPDAQQPSSSKEGEGMETDP